MNSITRIVKKILNEAEGKPFEGLVQLDFDKDIFRSDISTSFSNKVKSKLKSSGQLVGNDYDLNITSYKPLKVENGLIVFKIIGFLVHIDSVLKDNDFL